MLEIPLCEGKHSQVRRTAAATDSSMRELYHGCLCQAEASNRTGCEVVRILPTTAVSSRVRGKVHSTAGKSH